MKKIILDFGGRINLNVNDTITLNIVNSENDSRTFTITEVLGCGGTAIAYKVCYDGSDNTRYLYVLKEIYPVPAEGYKAIERNGASLNIDEYEETVSSPYSYRKVRKQFEDAYHIQNYMATGDNAVSNITTSLPIGLYEDRASSKNGNYAVYGLFQYYIGKTLQEYKESSLAELIDIMGQVAEVVRAYHEHGYLWLDIKEANVNVVGAGAVQRVSMFDFGSLISIEKLLNYNANKEADFVLSFSPTSSNLLLPKELETMLSMQRIFGFAIVDVKKNEIFINALGESGIQTDVFLLGSMLFKRLSGNAPSIKDCEQLQDGTFDMSRFKILTEYPAEAKEIVKRILVNTLNYNECHKRYPSVSAYLADINKLYGVLLKKEAMSHLEKNTREYVAYCCEKYREIILEGEANGKFKHLKALQGNRFHSRVKLRSDSSGNELLPSAAINSAPNIKGKDEHNRLVFLYGDGGMGKSTALYDYICETRSVTPIYIELSQYNHLENSILNFIYTKICKKFADAVGYLDNEDIGKTEQALLGSLTNLEPKAPQPQYVLLLDGYNEIAQEERGFFDNEIKDIIDNYLNCRIVITGRNLPADYEGKRIPAYDHFNRFEFIGISVEERRRLIESNYPQRADRIQNDERLWDVLKIPMFMGMYLQLNIDTSAVVHTRGEILDQFITKTEKDAAEEIAKRQTRNAENAALRRFIVCFSLTFAANAMDADRLFSLDKNTLLARIQSGNLLYLVQRVGANKVSVYDCVTSNTVTKTAIGFDDDRFDFKQMIIQKKNPTDIPIGELERLAMADMFSIDSILHILSVEAGYFYRTTNGAYEFTHQYFRDYFAAKHIQNILITAQTLDNYGLTRDEQLQFTKDCGLDYTWSDDVCILLGEIIGDYKNEPGYSEK